MINLLQLVGTKTFELSSNHNNSAIGEIFLLNQFKSRRLKKPAKKTCENQTKNRIQIGNVRTEKFVFWNWLFSIDFKLYGGERLDYQTNSDIDNTLELRPLTEKLDEIKTEGSDLSQTPQYKSFAIEWSCNFPFR